LTHLHKPRTLATLGYSLTAPPGDDGGSPEESVVTLRRVRLVTSTSFARPFLPLALVGAVIWPSALSAGSAQDPPQYEITDLGVLDSNVPAAVPKSLNIADQVVGYSSVVTPAGSGEPRAFLYTADAGMREIVPLSLRNYAHGINARGDVVGSRSPKDFVAPVQAFLYTSSDEVVSGLPGVPGPSEALAVNKGGQIVGYAGGSYPFLTGARAFLWSDTGVIDIHAGLPTVAKHSVATALNAAGAVVGWYYVGERQDSSGGPDYRAFMRDASGGLTVLPSPDGWGTQAVAVNAAGQIAGTATAAYPQSRAMLWEANGTFKDLGSLGTGTRSSAWGLNADGVVVGEAWTGGWSGTSLRFPIYHAFIYRGGTMKDLNNLIPPGYELRTATAINDKGQIVAHGNGPLGSGRAFLLTPVLSPVIASLITTVESFQLPKGIENSFVVKLEHALAALDAGDTATACAELQAFVNHAEAQSGKKITVAQATQIIAEAQAIRAALGCS
jgi:probable HAF family extracellular repeat protein